MLEYGAEIVVVATGAHWATDGLNGSTHEPIPGADASLGPRPDARADHARGQAPAGRRVVVYDGDGYFMALGIAELLAREGYDVELVTCLETIAPFTDETLEGPLLRRRPARARRRAAPRRRTVTAIEPGRVSGEDEFGEPVELAARRRRARHPAAVRRRALPRARRRRSRIPVYRIGDCVAPRHPCRRDLRRPPAGARDRLAEPRRAAPLPARAARSRSPRASPRAAQRPLERQAETGAAISAAISLVERTPSGMSRGWPGRRRAAGASRGGASGRRPPEASRRDRRHGRAHQLGDRRRLDVPQVQPDHVVAR